MTAGSGNAVIAITNPFIQPGGGEPRVYGNVIIAILLSMIVNVAVDAPLAGARIGCAIVQPGGGEPSVAAEMTR